VATTGDERRTDSDIEVKPVYTAADTSEELELPGEFPFTRGPYPDMYRGRPWTIRQYAGFASAEETNQRFRYLLERGQTGLSVAFDLPTQLGYDSDDPRAVGEVGRTGVAIDSIADMELLFDQIPLSGVSTSMTINAPAALLLLLYELVAEEQGVRGDQLRGTVQNLSPGLNSMSHSAQRGCGPVVPASVADARRVTFWDRTPPGRRAKPP
jgi:methylmalonyl-CoA mutase N-terminal domain/subunit